MEVYVDEMLVKSRKADHYITNPPKTFRILRKYQMKLNPSNALLESKVDASSATW
ncbi:UNVERIFIED_CONTAM: hypothetical protein Slati_0165100 [Sesamum latifolium]|uniref:Uncharacterized protein n=1 Tax=Sesamum latifolium TaxID=2727402 RepID=A0AAW2YAC3_9LAMI